MSFNWQFSALFSSASVFYVPQLSCTLVGNKELQQWYPLVFKTFRQTNPQNSYNRMVHYTQRKFCCFTKHFSEVIKPAWLLHNNYWATEEEQRINQTARYLGKDADPNIAASNAQSCNHSTTLELSADELGVMPTKSSRSWISPCY